MEVPVIDLTQTDDQAIAQQIATACSNVGFFQVVNHGISDELLSEFRSQCAAYFALDPTVKEQYRRNETNARGYFDNELTKQRRDWKQALDVGVPGCRDWTVRDDHVSNKCLDGFNQLPTDEELLGFRETIIKYFEACSYLSHRLTVLMASGLTLGSSTAESNDSIVDDLRNLHTSYLRLNYYPACPLEVVQTTKETQGSPPLGISPHRDAGFLTVLLPDEECHSLQVYQPNTSDTNDGWHTVHPIPGALTINTGDMAQIWSNGTYQAPLHRVLTHPDARRYSAPFFYNPGYATWIQPRVHFDAPTVQYQSCLWGYFRAVRFAGDLTDLGVEIQVEDYLLNGAAADEGSTETEESNRNPHWIKQATFAKVAKLDEPFSVERFRSLLTDTV